MRALVLSGGGAKGSYQVGVWKALRQLGIKIDIVTGTSAGAINGALIVQGSYWKALKIWNKLKFNNIFGKEINNDTELEVLYKIFAKNFLTDGGTEVKELHKLINKTLNKNRFYKSKIDYGLVTVDISNKRIKPIELQKKEIPEDKLGEYILASASCFPAFKKMVINGKEYIDGGYYDNLPINLAIKMGATEAIVVDLGAIGIKKITKKNIKQINIKPKNNLSNFLQFNPNNAKRNIKYGYNDTMKAFGKLDGNKYTFKLNEIENIEKQFKEKLKSILDILFNNVEQLESFKKLIKIDKKEKIKKELINLIIEDIGYKYNIDDTKIYTEYSFNSQVYNKVSKDLRSEKEDKTLEIYKLLKNNDYKNLKKEVLLRPFDILRAIYIYIITEG